MSTYVCEGKVVGIMPVREGQGKNGGEWQCREFMIQTETGNKMCFIMFRTVIERSILTMGSNVRVGFDISSSEYNGRYYTKLYVNSLINLQPC